jgi:phage FluMu protein Com
VAAPLPFQFRCRFCGWQGADATLDAHLNAFCPQCGKFADPVLPGR